ncbi:MAG: helix-turn-helix transcriptional regulator [Natronomonas sp.]
MDVSDAFPEDALADVAFLSRSKNRAQILAMLAAESYTRRELEDTTGISRTTLDRIVNELEERDWATRTSDGDYVATPTGERIATESSCFVGAIQAIRNLADAVAWLPRNELTIGLHQFREAIVRRPEPNAMSAPTTAATKLMQEATEFACLMNTLPSLAFEESMINGVLEGRLMTKHVITDEELTVLLEDTNRTGRWQEYIEAGANLYCYDGQIPCNLLVIDETVLILDRQPEAPEGIESTNPEVRAWATEMIDEYRKEAKQLDATAFTKDREAQQTKRSVEPFSVSVC